MVSIGTSVFCYSASNLCPFLAFMNKVEMMDSVFYVVCVSFYITYIRPLCDA